MRLRLYSNQSPNTGRNAYIFATSDAEYLNALGIADYLITDVSKFTYQNGILRVRIENAADPEANMKAVYRRITYAVIDETDSSYFKCYFITSSEYRSGCVLFNIEPDMWGTYISQVKLGTFFVTRCNRNIGHGYYDPIAYTEGEATTTSLIIAADENPTLSDFAIYYVAVNQTGVESIFTDNASSFMALYANTLQAFESTRPEAITNPIDWAIIAVGGINAVKGVYATSDIEAYVMKAYIAPDIYQSYITSMPIFKSKTIFTDGDDTEITPGRIQSPYAATWRQFDITIDPNNEYYVGTKFHGLQLPRSTQPVTVGYKFIFGQSDIRVLVSVGDKSLDITEDFEVSLTTASGIMTETERISQILGLIAGTALPALGTAAAGGGAALGAITGAASTAGNLLGQSQQGNGRVIGAGNGALTCRLGPGIEFPYKQRTFKSTQDEQAKARLFGANFAEYCDDMADIMEHAFLGGGAMSAFNLTYIEATVAVSGVPDEARKYIEDCFSSGIYIQYNES